MRESLKTRFGISEMGFRMSEIDLDWNVFAIGDRLAVNGNQNVAGIETRNVAVIKIQNVAAAFRLFRQSLILLDCLKYPVWLSLATFHRHPAKGRALRELQKWLVK